MDQYGFYAFLASPTINKPAQKASSSSLSCVHLLRSGLPRRGKPVLFGAVQSRLCSCPGMYCIHACIHAGVPAHAAAQATILRVICRAATFVGLQPVYVYMPGVESASRRYVYVRTGAELLPFYED